MHTVGARTNRTTLSPRTLPDRLDLTLGELVEIVSSVVPEHEVAQTVAALFGRGLASFRHPLRIDGQQPLARAS